MNDAGGNAPWRGWINGEPCHEDQRGVSVRDRGFTLGDGVFETMRLRGGRVFRLPAHRARLARGLAALAIPEPAMLDRWIAAAVSTSNSSMGGDAAMRVTVTRGVGAPGLAPPRDVRPTVVVTVGVPPRVDPEVYQRGLGSVVAQGRRNERAQTAGLKTTAYAEGVMALLEARRAGEDEAIFLDTQGRCSEATASNLFIWAEGHLLTPSVACGALPGITRAAVLELADALGWASAERPFAIDALYAADEAFLTSSLRGVVPLVRIEGRPIGRGGPGERTQRLMSAYEALVDRECRG